MKIHKSVTTDRILEVLEADEYLGFCVACGHEQDGCEPDAQRYICEDCGQAAVYGAEQILFMTIG